MKNTCYPRLAILIFSLFLSFRGYTSESNPEPGAKFDTLWIEFDQVQDGLKGMLVHLSFSVFDLKDTALALALYFDDEDEVPLKDHNQKYYTTKGNVALFYDLKPGYVTTDYKDLRLFMPYDELDLEGGKYELSLSADLIHADGRYIEHFTYYDFSFTQPSKTSTNAILEKMWVDYDVTDAGKFGMRIHLKFSVLNLKDAKLGMAVYFFKKNGDKLLSDHKDYASKSGQLALFKAIDPLYTNSVFDDLQVFLPYSELPVPAGKSELMMQAKIIYYDTGNLVKMLKEYPFNFTK